MNSNPLMAAFEFTDDDLQYNRRGTLSPRQQELYADVVAATKSYTTTLQPILIGSAVVSVGGILLGLIVAPIMSIIFAGVLLFVGWSWWQMQNQRQMAADAEGHVIQRASGVASVEQMSVGAGVVPNTSGEMVDSVPYIKIGDDHHFSWMTEAQVSAFEEGQTYTVYFMRAPVGVLVVSAERRNVSTA